MDSNLLIEAIYVLFWLIIFSQFKHFIADYPLQNKFMLGKFKKKGWVLPLAAHCAVHFGFTYSIAAVMTENSTFAMMMAGLDFVIHFVMDRIKASPDMLGKYKALNKFEIDYLQALLRDYTKEWSDYVKLRDSGTHEVRQKLAKRVQRQEEYMEERWAENAKFWYALGLDQKVHHITDAVIALLIIKQMYGV